MITYQMNNMVASHVLQDSQDTETSLQLQTVALLLDPPTGKQHIRQRLSSTNQLLSLGLQCQLFTDMAIHMDTLEIGHIGLVSGTGTMVYRIQVQHNPIKVHLHCLSDFLKFYVRGVPTGILRIEKNLVTSLHIQCRYMHCQAVTMPCREGCLHLPHHAQYPTYSSTDPYQYEMGDLQGAQSPLVQICTIQRHIMKLKWESLY